MTFRIVCDRCHSPIAVTISGKGVGVVRFGFDFVTASRLVRVASGRGLLCSVAIDSRDLRRRCAAMKRRVLAGQIDTRVCDCDSQCAGK